MTRTTADRAAIAILLALVVSIAIAACGGGSSGSIASNPDNEKVSLTIGSTIYPEGQILSGEIYAQALEAAGYKVKRDLGLGVETAAQEALLSGKISGYPIHVWEMLTFLYGVDMEDDPADAHEAFEMAKGKLKKDGLTAFPPTPYSFSYAVGTRKQTADRLGLTKVSDLKGKSEGLTLSGAPECPETIDCLVGLKKYYGLEFNSFDPAFIDARYEALDNGEADLSMLFSTDAQLAAEGEKYVILDEDKQAFPAGNTIFVTSQKVAKEAGPDYERTITEVQKGLTLPVIQKLNAQVESEGQSPEAVATQYLESAGYID